MPAVGNFECGTGLVIVVVCNTVQVVSEWKNLKNSSGTIKDDEDVIFRCSKR
jgi:hypothetical protein